MVETKIDKKQKQIFFCFLALISLSILLFNFFYSFFIGLSDMYKRYYKRDIRVHTGQCKRTGGCYNELVVAFYSTGGGVKGKKIYTC